MLPRREVAPRMLCIICSFDRTVWIRRETACNSAVERFNSVRIFENDSILLTGTHGIEFGDIAILG